MARKKTGGRQKGTPNKATVERQAEIAASGVTPLAYMIAVMRDETQAPERRDDMAKAAAPYVHPRLASAEIKTESTVRYVARVPDKAPNTTAWQQQHLPEATQH